LRFSVQQMQHQTRAARAHRMTVRNRAAFGVEERRVHGAGRRVHPEFLARVLRAVPRRLTGQHLRGKSLVEFHLLQVAHFQILTHQQLRHGMHRPQSHLAWIDAGPFVIDPFAEHGKSVAFHRLVAREQQHGGAVGHLCFTGGH
jgi:hypothetical protein